MCVGVGTAAETKAYNGAPEGAEKPERTYEDEGKDAYGGKGLEQYGIVWYACCQHCCSKTRTLGPSMNGATAPRVLS